MLWTARWLGQTAALVTGTVLALDPTFFFGSLIDWGSVTPSLLCRALCFYLVWLWWQRKENRYVFLAGAAAGFGFFHKIDIAVLLAGAAAAGVCAYGGLLPPRIRAGGTWTMPAFYLGFIPTAGLMLIQLPTVFQKSLDRGHGQLPEKIHTMVSMYDGSYFYQLMYCGGSFPLMSQAERGVFVPLAGVLLLAGVGLIVGLIRRQLPEPQRRAVVFLLLSLVLVTLGILLTPGAVRLHHSMLILPIPHLVVGFAFALAWRQLSAPRPAHLAVRVLLSAVLGGLLICDALAILKTQRFMLETGGRGWWSQSFSRFCNEVKDRRDITIVSLDWGFNEQLLFRTQGPRLLEPIWDYNHLSAVISRSTNYIYLVHEPKYTLFSCGGDFLKEAQLQTGLMDIQPYYNREHQVDFYAIRYLDPEH
jgi:hypothetical protein